MIEFIEMILNTINLSRSFAGRLELSVASPGPGNWRNLAVTFLLFSSNSRSPKEAFSLPFYPSFQEYSSQTSFCVCASSRCYATSKSRVTTPLASRAAFRSSILRLDEEALTGREKG
ncbi:hypothetical protein QTG54_015779 [Skeletonema marinoi]|uniref:Uncharacterized protein n=1 Tax=Skeletonema marinoi TaxID=267567 RepID=A0AAD8XTD1_9STRA|nr:hypothetical protein QTG54_015779 [Skeletonema marinoi]